MISYIRHENGTLVDAKSLGVVTLNEIRHQVVKGEHVQVLEGTSQEEVTNEILLEVLVLDSKRFRGAAHIQGALEQMIIDLDVRRSTNRRKIKPLDYDDQTLATWTRWTTTYLDIQGQSFGRRFCSQQFFRVIATSASLYWRDIPIECGELMDVMTQGSRNTRFNRISHLVAKGWFERVRQGEDRRRVVLQPTVVFQELLESHFSHTLAFSLAVVDQLVGLDIDVTNFVDRLMNRNDPKSRNLHLAAWAEYLITSAEKWADRLFGYEYLETEYLLICTHVVLSRLLNKPLTFSKLVSLSNFASARIMKDRINRCKADKLIETVKSDFDRRVVVYSPTPKLEVLVKEYVTTLLNDFRHLAAEFT